MGNVLLQGTGLDTSQNNQIKNHRGVPGGMVFIIW